MVMKDWCYLELVKVLVISVVCRFGLGSEVDLGWSIVF